MFWTKKVGRKILNNIRNIQKDLKKLSDVAKKRSKALAIIDLIQNSVDSVKREILERAEEEKSHPWIDSKFDSQIDSLAASEIVELDKLRSSLSDYVELFQASESHKDIDIVVNDLFDEEKQIMDRESKHAAKIQNMEITTGRARFHKSDNIPPLKTSDRVSWRNIINVCSQLGGWFEATGDKHQGVLRFPSSKRPIPLSSDLSSTNLARQIRQQLKLFLPEHKIPNNQKLRAALTHGDIHDVG